MEGTKASKFKETDTIDSMPPPLSFKVLKTFKYARASVLTLPHGDVRTPVYMPVGTKGAMKGLL
jgi:hypothetical protein